MKKILQAFKKLFRREKKEKPIYLCDPEKATSCSKGPQCWYFNHGPCRCTRKKQWSKSDKFGRPMIATPMDIWNEEYREWCLEHPEYMLGE